MKTYVMFRRHHQSQNEADDYTKRLDDKHIEYSLVEADSMEGVSMVDLYDVVRLPSVLVTRDDGQLVRMWLGELPDLSELSDAAQSQI